MRGPHRQTITNNIIKMGNQNTLTIYLKEFSKRNIMGNILKYIMANPMRRGINQHIVHILIIGLITRTWSMSQAIKIQ